LGVGSSWVTPEHVVPQILEALPAALAQSLRPPIVHNTSSYDSSDSLRLMEGAVDIYIPDIKLWTRERSPSLPRQARVRLSSVTW
jgi:putative pyruvate formate lyase activating enzyme